MSFACVFNPVGCASAWYHGIDPLWFLMVGLVVGLLLGAWLGKWGVAALAGIALAGLFLFKRGGVGPIEQLPENHPDAQPSHPKPHGKYQGIPGYDSDTGMPSNGGK